MEGLRSYLLSITAAAVIIALVRQITGEKTPLGKILKIVTGVFMTVTVISPLIQFNIQDIDDFIQDFQLSSQYAVDQGTQMAAEELSKIIKQQTEAYILDEASKMGMEMSVEVKLSDSNPPQPCFVTLQGAVSPYQRKHLSQHITEYLGISQENQQWI